MFIAKFHRHHQPVQGHRFSIGAFQDEECRGVCVVGRPLARAIPPYEVAEVTRLASDGTKNVCSLLYSASSRACREMGFLWIQTYTLVSEPGTSLKASGWSFDGDVPGRLWPSFAGQLQDKKRWVKKLN